MSRLLLVRHGRPLVDRSRPAHEWSLDPASYDAVWALRGRLAEGVPATAAWFSSPEAKALETAQLLTDGPVAVVEGLREHRRDSTDWIDDFAGTVRRAFAEPDRPAHPGWEPLSACRDRVTTAVREILAAHADRDVVLSGHGTAWTVLTAVLTSSEPDLDRWERLAMPDLIEVEIARRASSDT